MREPNETAQQIEDNDRKDEKETVVQKNHSKRIMNS